MRFAFILMVALMILTAQRAILAQSLVSPETGRTLPWLIRGLNALGISSEEGLAPLFWAVLLLTLLNLSIAGVFLVRRLRSRSRARAEFRGIKGILALPNHSLCSDITEADRRLEEFFRSQGWKPVLERRSGDTLYRAARRESGLWGGFWLHLGFVVIAAGALLSGLSRQAGYVELGIGDTFNEGRQFYQQVSKSPFLFAGDRRFSLRLEDTEQAFWKPGKSRERTSVVSVADGEGNRLGTKRIAVNRPLSIEGMIVYQGSRGGFTAGLTARDSRGTTTRGTVHFAFPKNAGEPMSTQVTLPGTSLHLYLEFFSNQLKKVPGLESLSLQHQATLLKVYTLEGPRRIFRGVVFGGGALEVEGVTLRFDSLRPFTSFLIVRDYGIPLIYGGFVVFILGLLMTYFWVPEICWAAVSKAEGETRVAIGAITDKYRESFAERFRKGVERLEKEYTIS